MPIFLCFDLNFAGVFLKIEWQQFSIVLGTGLAMNKWQAITWNIDPVCWRMFVSPGLDEVTPMVPVDFFYCHHVYKSRADSRFAPSQWETALLCNVSHWLGASLKSALKGDAVTWKDDGITE